MKIDLPSLLERLKTFVKTEERKDLLIHIGSIFGITILLLVAFFYIYLPVVTNHGETITVPDVRGVKLSELDDFLESRNLRYEVTADSGFSATMPPLAVLKQTPLPDSKVKENRKIYVTLNAEHAPLIRMPKLVGGSVKNAELILKSYDLVRGEVTYVPDLALNYVLEQSVKGRPVMEGERIPKGSIVDLVAGDGLGTQSLESPNVIGLDPESAQSAIVGSGLKIGEIKYVKDPNSVIDSNSEEINIEDIRNASPGTVFMQRPKAGEMMIIGQMVDIWVYGPDATRAGANLLDND